MAAFSAATRSVRTSRDVRDGMGCFGNKPAAVGEVHGVLSATRFEGGFCCRRIL